MLTHIDCFCVVFLIFRMSFEDFCSHFTNATLCHVINTSIFSLSNRWHVFKHNYQWSPGSTAGGCVENRSTFLKNPQVHNIFLWALIYLCVLSFSLFGNWRNVHVFTQSLHFFSIGEPKPCNRHFLFLSKKMFSHSALSTHVHVNELHQTIRGTWRNVMGEKGGGGDRGPGSGGYLKWVRLNRYEHQ